MTFQDELRALLRRYKVEWDERYLLGLGGNPFGVPWLWLDSPSVAASLATLG